MSNESYDRVNELQQKVEIQLMAQMDRYDRRVETCNTLGLTFEAEDYNDTASEEFYVTAAALEAEKARFDSLCESAAKTLTAAFTYEDAPGTYPTGKILTQS